MRVCLRNTILCFEDFTIQAQNVNGNTEVIYRAERFFKKRERREREIFLLCVLKHRDCYVSQNQIN